MYTIGSEISSLDVLTPPILTTLSPPPHISRHIQGSALGPAMFVLNGIDLQSTSAQNYMPAYADDTYLLFPSDNETRIDEEFSSIIAWASQNNILLNHDKSLEIIFHKSRTKCQ